MTFAQSIVRGRKVEGEDVVLWFLPVGRQGQVLFRGDVQWWTLNVFDRTERALGLGTGSIQLTAQPAVGSWVRLFDGLNNEIFYELGVATPSSPYNARAVALGADAEATRDNLYTEILADFTAGFLNMLPGVDGTDTIDLTFTGDPADGGHPIRKQGNNLVVAGMTGTSHFQLVEQAPAATMFTSIQTSADDPGFTEPGAGFTFRYVFPFASAPLLGGHVYDFEIQLMTYNDGVVTLRGRVTIEPMTSQITEP